MMICREPCLQTNEIKSYGDVWALEYWTPLIQNKCFIEDIIHVPQSQDLQKVRKVSIAEIYKLENVWLFNKNGTLEEGKEE